MLSRPAPGSTWSPEADHLQSRGATRSATFATALLLAASLTLVAIGVASRQSLADGTTAPPVVVSQRAATQQAAPSASTAIRAVVSVGMTVSDLRQSIAFYGDILGFELIDEHELDGEPIERLQGVFGLRMRMARMRLGEEVIELSEYLAPRGRPIPADSRSTDRWFQHIAIITPDMDAAYARLRRHDVRHASTGPQTLPDWNPSAGGIRAFYFLDPDGHVLEILQFPDGKGDPRWKRLAGNLPDRLFLGIDHTAIVVRDTDASLAFYHDALGMEIVGSSENWGPEQERLNNVFGARLRITTLAARGTPSGPKIELLEYLAPGGGRSYPADSKSCDLWHWQTTVSVLNADAAWRAARQVGGSLVSPGVVDVSGDDRALGSAALVRDPDGHAIRLARPM